jgi:serine/threonine protein kinase/tetratricopeptide (TPR) repeat protein
MNQPAPGIEEIFFAALELEGPDARSSFLDKVCGDPALRQRVERLLAQDAQASGFLESPAPFPTATTRPDDPSAVEVPGTVIGPYKLLEQIGEGGMGFVYMAEQTQPVRRKVALKIIKPGMDTKQVIARFEAERQALALMDHPNIARVLDAGATESGRPYFIMELIRGIPITEYCDRETLSISDRLGLFTQVCQAVQHAHQKGIIHRDIKPSNVLVTLHDGVPVPKVIDFGVAKAIGQQLTEKTLFTGFAQLVGTPLYMSPEQAGLSGLDMDTRSDIYSLGVLLYELLTGTTPFDQDTFRTAAFDEIRRIIREQEPPRPSTRLSTLGATLTTVSSNRGSDSRRLTDSMRGELDWIVMKALEKDRNRRYETASAFAADVRRHLDDEPVEACSPSAGYRLRKFARRNRVGLVTAVVVATALVAGTAVSTWQAVRAIRAERKSLADRNRAEDAERTARTEADRAKAVNDFLTEDLLTQAEPANNKVEDKVTLLEVLDRAADKVGERFRDQPEAESALRTTLARTYHALGAFAKAELQAQSALNIERRIHGPEAAGTLRARAFLAHVWHFLGRISEAVEALEQASQGLQRTLGPDDLDTLESRTNLAAAYREAGRLAAAMHTNEDVLALRTAKLGPYHPDTLNSRNEVSADYFYAGRVKEATEICEEVLALRTEKLGLDHPDTLESRDNLAVLYQRAGRRDDAIRMHELTLQLLTKRLGPDHRDTLTNRQNLAAAYYHAGRRSEAIRLNEETIELLTAKLGANHPDTLGTRGQLISWYMAVGRTVEAIRVGEEVLKLRTAKLSANHPHTITSGAFLAEAYNSVGRWTEAEPLLRDALARHRKTDRPDAGFLARGQFQLGRNLVGQSRWKEAEPVLREALAVYQKSMPDYWVRYQLMTLLGGALFGQGRYREAEPLLLAGYDGLNTSAAKGGGPNRLRLIEAAERIVRLYEASGKPEQAAQWKVRLGLSDLPANVFASP